MSNITWIMKTPHTLTPYKHVPLWKPISTNNSVADSNKICNYWERIKKYNNGMCPDGITFVSHYTRIDSYDGAYYAVRQNSRE
jgi:hypothetical protein